MEIFDKVSEDKKLNILEFVEEKFERRLSEENVQTNNRITEEVASLRVEISQTEADIIRWMFIFWIGQFASIAGTLTAILFAFFR